MNGPLQTKNIINQGNNMTSWNDQFNLKIPKDPE